MAKRRSESAQEWWLNAVFGDAVEKLKVSNE